MNKEILRMEEIESYLGGKKILSGARLNLFQNEIIGIIGVNYSGKSTLIGGIAGFYPYAAGRSYLNEESICITSIEQARKAGIFYIQKQSSLIEDFTILENLFLTVKEKTVLINKKEVRNQCLEIMELLEIQADITDKVGTLSFKNRILVEIAKAIVYDVRILVMDDVLNGMSQEALKWFSKLFYILRSLRISIILVETTLRCLKPYCDRLFIMRDGKTASVLDKKHLKEDEIISYMIGYPLNEREEGIRAVPKELPRLENLLEFSGVYFENILHGLDFKVTKGSITGMLNVNKNSGKAVERLLMGLGCADKGEIIFDGKTLLLKSTEQALQAGIAVVPEDDRIFWEFSIEENIMMSALKMNRGLAGRLNRGELKYISGELFSDYMKSACPYCTLDSCVPESRLAQKKIALCRVLASDPALIVLVNPAQTIDVISKDSIYADIMTLKAKGKTVLLITSDIKEMFDVCDRIIVVNQGKTKATFSVTDGNRDQLLQSYGESLRDI